MILRSGTRTADQRHFAGVGRNVGADARVVHAVETNPAFDVFKAMLGGCCCDLVVLGGRDQIVGSGVENDVRWKRQVTDRVVLTLVAKTALIVLRVRW